MLTSVSFLQVNSISLHVVLPGLGNRRLEQHETSLLLPPQLSCLGMQKPSALIIHLASIAPVKVFAYKDSCSDVPGEMIAGESSSTILLLYPEGNHQGVNFYSAHMERAKAPKDPEPQLSWAQASISNQSFQEEG